MFDDRLQTLDDTHFIHHQEQADPALAKLSLAITIIPASAIHIAPASPVALPPGPLIMPPVTTPAMAPHLLHQGLQEAVEPDVQPADETIEQDDNHENKEAELRDQDNFNKQLNEQNKERADSLEDPNFENLFREQKIDNQSISQQASPALVTFNETDNITEVIHLFS